jgi:hypothetical protein
VPQNSLAFVVKCAAVLPTLWLVLFLVARRFQGGEPFVSIFVTLLPTGYSLTSSAARWFTGRHGFFPVSLTVLVVGTAIELAFLGAVAGVAIRGLSRGRFPGQSAWLACFLIYVACQICGYWLTA